MANHVAALSRSCFFYARQLKSIKQSLTPEVLKTLVYAFISALELTTAETVRSQASVVNCFRGCKPSRTLLPVSSLGPARRSRHMTLTLLQLHWLPIRQRILFKMAVLVYECRHGMVPSYLSTYCLPTSSHDGRCHLRSAVSGQLSNPCTHND